MTIKDEKVGGSLQENLLVLLAWSETASGIIRNSVRIDLFASDLFRRIIHRIYEYLDQYKGPPKDHLPDICEDLLQDKDTGDLVASILESVHNLRDRINEEYVLSQLASFIRQQGLKIAIAEASEALQSGNMEQAEVVLEKAMRARLDLFDTGMTLEQAFDEVKKGVLREPLIIGIPELDRNGLGPARKELHIFLAPRKKGKSWWLIHAGKCALRAKLRVLYVTLELSAGQVGQRFLMSLFGLASRQRDYLPITRMVLNPDGTLQELKVEEIRNLLILHPDDATSMSRIRKQLEHFHARHNLRIKQFPTGALTVRQLEAYLDGLERKERFMPDVLLVDYANLMRLNIDHYRLELGNVYKDLRGLAVERNMMVLTAVQSNRMGAGADTVRDIHGSEDFSFSMTADNILTFSQTEEEKKLGLARLQAGASRTEADGIMVCISQQYATGQFCLQSMLMNDSYWTHIGSEVDMNQAEE
jgi:replicative DNA helicase